MPHFMIVLILYINLLNLSWIKKKCLFLRNMEASNKNLKGCPSETETHKRMKIEDLALLNL